MMRENGSESDEGRARATRRRGSPWFLGGLVLLLLSALVVLQLFGLWEIFTPDTASDTLLIYALSTLNFVAFFLFTFIFIRNLLKLRRERRERLLGSKIKTRLVVYFIAVSLLPITAMAVFSFLFFNRSLEKWFGSLPEGVVQQARQIQADEARRQAQSFRETALLALDALGETATVATMPEASQAAEASQASSDIKAKLDLLAERGNLSLLSISEPEGSGPSVAARGLTQTDAETIEAGARSSLNLESPQGEISVGGRTFDVMLLPLGPGRTLTAARERRDVSRLTDLVNSSQTFEDFKRQQRRVRLLGLSTLGLLTLLLLFAATWAAIHLARGIGTPIRALAEASKEVAAGNLEHRVNAIADDELAVLASAFNDMTAQLAENRRRIEANAAELREKNLALEERRHYIETVLQTVSTGVISLDEDNRVTTINAAALGILRLDETPPAQTPLSEVVGAEDHALLERVAWRARVRGRAAEQLELARGAVAEVGGVAAGGGNGGGVASREGNGGAAPGVIPVALTATALTPRAGDGRRGVVLVIEDLSELLAAQRAAAWSEVARRLAHEIKNPLTPIQLSAERIARHFRRAEDESAASETEARGGSVEGNGRGTERERVARVVEECTATIGREVAGLKAMVDEFTRFARLPHARLEPADLNEVVRQAVTLYEDRLEGVRMDVLLAPQLPGALLDSEQLRRVFVNLIDNSIEAMAGVEGERRITVATGHDPARGLLIAEVADTGHGIARADFGRLFEPYFSTRGRGTGLGLAIVHRIMTEHGGRIRAELNRPRGARMIIELPVAEDNVRHNPNR